MPFSLSPEISLSQPLPETDAVEYYSGGYNQGSSGANYFKAANWQLCSGPSLRGHIANAHLQPHILEGIGLPLYDVEVAKVRGIGLGWVVRKAVQKLELSDGELSEQIENVGVHLTMTPADYRLAIVKTICLISQHGMAYVPWSAVNRVYRGASEVTINAALECDMSFLDTHHGEQALEDAHGAATAGFGPIYKAGGLKSVLTKELAQDDFRVKLD